MPLRARRPAQWAPSDSNGHNAVPGGGCCPGYTKGPEGRFAGFAAARGERSHRRDGGSATTGGRASRPARSRGASARGAGSRGSVSSGIESPPFPWFADRGRADRTPTASSTDSHAALTPCPAKPETAEHGEPSLSIWEARDGPFRVLRRHDAVHGRSMTRRLPVLESIRANGATLKSTTPIRVPKEGAEWSTRTSGCARRWRTSRTWSSTRSCRAGSR